MIKYILFLAFTFALPTVVATIDDETKPKPPTKPPVQKDKPPKKVKKTISPVVNDLLDSVETACSELKSFQGKMEFTLLDQMNDAKTVRNGKLYYSADNKTVQARIQFTDLLQRDLLEDNPRNKPIKFEENFIFDGLWVTRDNSQTKTRQRWEVSKTSNHKDAFRLGKGPFPLPFAVQKKDVLKYFDVSLIPPAADQPDALKDADHLKLIPKKETEYAEEYKQMNLWIAQSNSVPVQISYESDDYEITTVTWTAIKTNAKIADKIFNLSKLPRGWTEDVKPLKQAPREDIE